ncbi:MAG: hypothetical protein ABIN01_08315 [Ferruginibacter sp.]
MTVAEMKLAAINEISKLNSESVVKEVLDHLIKISNESKTDFDTDTFFNKASEKYGDVLTKLAR